MVVTADIVKKV